ncbi:MAG: DUF1800 domain-containing protein [Verrucomicrobia bacterium]|nr:DUF1800 domain-containing protein [Verrucomicrobiota bacterium]
MIATLPSSAWDRAKAGQLLQRAAFGGTPEEIDQLAGMGPASAADLLLGPKALGEVTPPPNVLKPGLTEQQRFLRKKLRLLPPKDRESKARELYRAVRAEQDRRFTEIRGWWLDRMAHPAMAAREKLVLFLHGHFATSAEKVRNPIMLFRQNQLFREKGYGRWHELVLGVAKDPAMLLYLDGSKNRAGAPNENFARELFELFTLGVGNYTEQDIQESARAFAGWTVGWPRKPGEPEDQENTPPVFIDRKNWHDTKTKKIFGQRGSFDGEDVVRLALSQKAAPIWITRKLWRFYTGWVPEGGLQAELAEEWSRLDGEIRPFLKAMWTHPSFYDPQHAEDRVKSPTEWLVGLCRQLGGPLPAPALASNMLAELGQKLLEPPNVKGWDGGITWINTSTLAKRYEYTSWIVAGTRGMQKLAGMDLNRLAIESGLREIPPPLLMDPNTPVTKPAMEVSEKDLRLEAARKARTLLAISPAPVGQLVDPGERRDPSKLISVLTDRFLCGYPMPEEKRKKLMEGYGTGPMTDASIRKLILALVQSPVYQVT